MEIHFDQILLQALNFGILLVVLTKFLYKPILKILEQRAEKIDAGLTAAQNNIEERERLEDTKKQALKQAELRAAKIVEEAKAEAEKVAKELLEKAKADTAETLKKEEAAFQARLASQEKALMDRTSSLVINLSKAVMQKSLSSANQQEILDKQVKELDEMKIA